MDHRASHEDVMSDVEDPADVNIEDAFLARNALLQAAHLPTGADQSIVSDEELMRRVKALKNCGKSPEEVKDLATYELERLATIIRNEQQLLALGIKPIYKAADAAATKQQVTDRREAKRATAAARNATSSSERPSTRHMTAAAKEATSGRGLAAQPAVPSMLPVGQGKNAARASRPAITTGDDNDEHKDDVHEDDDDELGVHEDDDDDDDDDDDNVQSAATKTKEQARQQTREQARVREENARVREEKARVREEKARVREEKVRVRQEKAQARERMQKEKAVAKQAAKEQRVADKKRKLEETSMDTQPPPNKYVSGATEFWY